MRERDFRMNVCLVLMVLLLLGCVSKETPQESGSDVERVDEPCEDEEVSNQIVMEGDVEITFICHDYWDHFDAEAVGKYMENNPHAVFISTNVAASELKAAFPNLEGIQERVIAVQPEEGERILVTANGIDIEILNIPHGSDQSMRNNGYLFTVGRVRIFHSGDFAEHYSKLKDYKLPSEGIDIAFLPYFYLQNMCEYIQPKYVIPMHFDDPNPQDPDVKRAESLPYDIIMFYQSMQTISLREFLESQEGA